jgi:Ribonuclease G/E
VSAVPSFFFIFSKKVYQLEIERLNAEYINIESRPKLVVMTKEDVAAKLNEN